MIICGHNYCRVVLTKKNAAPSVLRRKRGYCRRHQREAEQKSRVKNFRQYLLRSSRKNAKRIGYKHTLTLADIPAIPEYCPIFPWIKLRRKAGKGGAGRITSPSIDRINNDKGYSPDNIRIVSDRANRLRNDASEVELVALLKDLRRLKSKE
jgi:hypothetical protein